MVFLYVAASLGKEIVSQYTENLLRLGIGFEASPHFFTLLTHLISFRSLYF
jgi:hypothetical protein